MGIGELTLLDASDDDGSCYNPVLVDGCRLHVDRDPAASDFKRFLRQRKKSSPSSDSEEDIDGEEGGVPIES